MIPQYLSPLANHIWQSTIVTGAAAAGGNRGTDEHRTTAGQRFSDLIRVAFRYHRIADQIASLRLRFRCVLLYITYLQSITDVDCRGVCGKTSLDYGV
jgi:hypothetical protein